MGIFLERDDSRGDHGLGRLVQFRFKAPPGTTSSSITTHTPSGQRNCASWASQPQKLVTLLPCPGGRTTKSTKDMWWHWERGRIFTSWRSARLCSKHVQEYNKLIIKRIGAISWSVTKIILRCTVNKTSKNTDMRRLTTGIRSEKCVFRRFRRCTNVYLHKPR